MSKYDAMWAWSRENGTDSFVLTFDEIGQIAVAPIDYSFLASKKELMGYGYIKANSDFSLRRQEQ